MAALAPMPSASVRTTMVARAFVRLSEWNAILRSRRKDMFLTPYASRNSTSSGLCHSVALPSLYSRTVGPEFDNAPKKFSGRCYSAETKSMWYWYLSGLDACAERACYDAISMSDAQEKPNRPRGHRITLDLLAKSASRTEPAFVAKPEGAPIYHGFQILSDVVVEGFTFGKISDFDAEPCTVSPSRHRRRTV